ncbi:MAG: citrate/2-methylcitrate synthase [Acidimicrobiales bacterium]
MELIDATTAARRLGVKRETLYAYVSRGTLASHPAPDGRRSLFEAAAVERLARRGRPRRATQRGAIDITLETAITELADRGVRYRGRPVGDLVADHTFEEVASILWRVPAVPTWPAVAANPDGQEVASIRRTCAALTTDAVAGDDPLRPTRDRPPSADEVAAAGRLLVASAVASLAPVGEDRSARLHLDGRPPVRGTVAGRLWPRLTARRATPPAVRTLNTALVLLADHELAASTLAVRVAASTWASPAGVVLAGLGALSGPLHGSASSAAREVLRLALERGSSAAVRIATAGGWHVPGFGHKVYAGTDPRAALLLDSLVDVGPDRTLRIARELVAEVGERTGRAPNIDLALAVLAECSAMTPAAGEVVMTTARIAGWLAHATEEYEQAPLRFRTRAAWVGPEPLSRAASAGPPRPA